MEKSGYIYICTLAQWHEASDRSLADHTMSECYKTIFRYIFEDLMPSNGEYNFAELDINKLAHVRRQFSLKTKSNNIELFLFVTPDNYCFNHVFVITLSKLILIM